jgi:hypothetical protein
MIDIQSTNKVNGVWRGGVGAAGDDALPCAPPRPRMIGLGSAGTLCGGRVERAEACTLTMMTSVLMTTSSRLICQVDGARTRAPSCEPKE